MNLKNFLEPVIGSLPNVAEKNEIEVLQEMPAQTAFFALKEANTDLAQWFFDNALPEQVQALVDLDCWNGDQFNAERFAEFFHHIARCSPEKLYEYTKEIDPEIIVRTLIEYADVFDFDPQEPPNVAEEQLLLSPDNLYAIILKTENPDLKESLYQWLNKLSAMDLQLMRRHLESCKWEQKTEIEEFAFTIKKGRLEDLGFVDRSEAVSLFSRGDAPSYKKYLLENPLEPKAKEESFYTMEHVEGAFVPEILKEPLAESLIFSEALKKISKNSIKEVLVMEALRSMNISIMADDLIHEDLQTIREATERSRRYMDLGLFYLSDGNIEKCADLMITQSLHSCTRLGWLLVHDLVHAASLINSTYPLNFWHSKDQDLLKALHGRHPEATPQIFNDLNVQTQDLISLESVVKVAERLNEISSLGQFFREKMTDTLALNTQSFMENETLLIRLLTALANQIARNEFAPRALTPEIWTELMAKNLDQSLSPMLDLVIKTTPEPGRKLLKKRVEEHLNEIKHYIQNKKDFPDPRFFKAFTLAQS
jgi:hypothetical protein